VGADTGQPLICLPGGPGRTPDYLGNLGVTDRELVFLELRGTGGSQAPADEATYRVDRMTEDIEALREHLGLSRIGLLGHSAGGDLALLYAARYPERIARLVLLTPALYSVGMVPSDQEFIALMERRSGEPWYEEALAAVRAADAGDDSAENASKYLPFYYGRWDAKAREHATDEASWPAPAVAAQYYADGAFDPPGTREQLRNLTAPVLVYAGHLDLGPTPEVAAELAAIFPAGQLIVQPGAGHFPWVDDPVPVGSALSAFLAIHP
jgi:pimeloyl-ACP methyl ester carboxylesterase